jgi:hypothetical protein
VTTEIDSRWISMLCLGHSFGSMCTDGLYICSEDVKSRRGYNIMYVYVLT